MPSITKRKIRFSTAKRRNAPPKTDGMVEFPEPKVPLPEGDKCLGLYMRCWNQLEMAIQSLLEKLLDTNPTAALIVYHGAGGARAVRDMITALGRNRLSEHDSKILTALMERAKTCTTKRNNIVHGAWQIVIKIHRHTDGHETGRSAQWVRWYDPSDPALLEEMLGPNGNKKLLANHRFTMRDLQQHAGHVENLGKDITAFVERVILNPYMHPQPITSSTQLE